MCSIFLVLVTPLQLSTVRYNGSLFGHQMSVLVGQMPGACFLGIARPQTERGQLITGFMKNGKNCKTTTNLENIATYGTASKYSVQITGRRGGLVLVVG